MLVLLLLGVVALVLLAQEEATGDPALNTLREQLLTGDDNVDRFAAVVASAVRDQFGAKAFMDLRLGRTVMMLIRKETHGLPAPQVGDQLAATGPSIGPMQVSRGTAKDLGLWQPASAIEPESVEYARLATDEDLGIRWGVTVFADKLRQAGGDLSDAIRRYNGRGSAAEAYRDNVLAMYSAHWGRPTTEVV